MNVHIFKSQAEQIDAIFCYIISSIERLLQTQEQVVIAVSGGKSPIPLLEKLSNANLDFSKIHVTLVDERIVETNNSDSNENLVRTHLLKNQAVNAKFTGLTDLSLSRAEMANAANQKINCIDLAILGMGEDGHTAVIPMPSSILNLPNGSFSLSSINKYPSVSTPSTSVTITLTFFALASNLVLSFSIMPSLE
jgi:6-phosphogluconolactonase